MSTVRGGIAVEGSQMGNPISSDGKKAYLALAGLAGSIWQTLGWHGQGRELLFVMSLPLANFVRQQTKIINMIRLDFNEENILSPTTNAHISTTDTLHIGSLSHR